MNSYQLGNQWFFVKTYVFFTCKQPLRAAWRWQEAVPGEAAVLPHAVGRAGPPRRVVQCWLPSLFLEPVPEDFLACHISRIYPSAPGRSGHRITECLGLEGTSVGPCLACTGGNKPRATSSL